MASSRLASLPASLPKVAIPSDVDPLSVAASFVPILANLQLENFTDDALWRDQFALTGTFRTFYSRANVYEAWKETRMLSHLHSFSLLPDKARVTRLPDGSAWVESWFSFRAAASPARTATAILLLVPNEDAYSPKPWKIWVLRTILEQLDGCGNVDVLPPTTISDIVHDNSPSHVDCVVVGAGQAGLATAGRLKALGVSYVVLEQNRCVGDNWAKRYKSTKLHTIRDYAHLPFDRTFPESYPEYLTKDDMARGYKDWVKKFGINIWLESAIELGAWDDKNMRWNLRIRRGQKENELTCPYLVFATGSGGAVPAFPQYDNRDKYQGSVLHSVDYVDCVGWAGKRGVVIGTANTAHDIAEDMLNSGLHSVTMIQRSTTYVLPAEYYNALTGNMYNSTVPTEDADRAFSSNPLAVSRELTNTLLNGMAQAEPERFNALERAGFKTQRYGSIMHHIYERLGGHYLDVGVSAKIAQGLIGIKSDSIPLRYTEQGLEFQDGSVLDADVVVFATGFETDMRLAVKRVLGGDIAAQLKPFWDLDEEGELTGEARTTGHPGIWMHGGTLGTARYYSRFIALQIKASLMGSPLVSYDKAFTIIS